MYEIRDPLIVILSQGIHVSDGGGIKSDRDGKGGWDEVVCWC